VRAQRAHGALDVRRRAGRVQRPVGGLDLVRVRDAGLVLLHPRRPLVERADEQVAAQRLEPLSQRPVVVVRPDRRAAGQAHGPRVEALGESHDRDAGLGIAGHDRALDRRGTAPARQQRRVHVDDLVAGEQRLADQHAVRADDEHLGLGRRDPRQHVVGMQRLRLDQVEHELTRGPCHRRRLERAAAAARPVRARDDERRPVGAAGQPLEHGGGERRGPEVDGAQVRPGLRRSPAACASLPCAGRGSSGPG
jgi:hypothetical protein